MHYEVQGMSRANGDTCEDTGGDGSTSPDPFSFSPEPTLEDTAASVLSLLLNETGASFTRLRTSHWPWGEGKEGSRQSSSSGSPMRRLAPKPGPPENRQPLKGNLVMSSSTW